MFTPESIVADEYLQNIIRTTKGVRDETSKDWRSAHIDHLQYIIDEAERAQAILRKYT